MTECSYSRTPLPGCSGVVSYWTTKGKNGRHLCAFHAQQELDILILQKQLERKQWPDQRNELKPPSPSGDESKGCLS